MGRSASASWCAAAVLGVGDVTVLDYQDQSLDRANTREAIEAIALDSVAFSRRSWSPSGPTAPTAIPTTSRFRSSPRRHVAAAGAADEPHQVAKLYHIAWSAATWDLYQRAFASAGCTVDGVERRAVPWPEWAITTVVDARPFWPTVWKAVSCHDSQVASYQRLKTLADADHEVLWGQQCFYRVFSAVNSGRPSGGRFVRRASGPAGRKP